MTDTVQLNELSAPTSPADGHGALRISGLGSTVAAGMGGAGLRIRHVWAGYGRGTLGVRGFGAPSGVGVGYLPRITGFGAVRQDPAYNIGYASVLLAGGGETGPLRYPGEGAGVLPFNGYAGPTHAGFGAIRIVGRGLSLPPPETYLALLQSHGVMHVNAKQYTPTIEVDLTEELRVRTATQTGFIVALRERLGIAGRPVSVLSTAVELEDTLAIRDVLQYALDVVLAEGLHLADDVDVTRRVLAQVTERLVLDGVATSVLDAQVTLAAALVLGGEVAAPFLAALIEALGIGETLDVRVARVVALLEELQIEAATSAGLTVVANVDETLLLADDAGATLTANVLLRESLECFGTLSINGDTWSCWLINTESKGVARYTNFPFNSFAKAPWGAYVGATDTGLYELGGDTDDGEPITARIRSALTDFGDRRAKRVPSMYVGYTATGQIGLKVISTSERGVKTEDHYLLEPRPAAGGVRESRFKIGRGIASVYLGFEVVNVGGADFALDVVEWLPIRLDRRVR